MPAQEKRVQPGSQATPLANEVLQLLMQQITGGGGGAAGGGGFLAGGGGGRGAGASTGDPLADMLAGVIGGGGGGGGQFPGPEFGLGLTPLQREAGTAARQFVSSGGGRFDISPELAQLEEIQRRRVTEGTADLREGFGIAGSRFGTPVAVGQARLTEGLETQFGAQIGELLRQEFAAQQERMLQGIGLLQNIGTANLEPFLRFAAMGIAPEQITFQENPFVSGAKAVGGILPFI